MLKYKVGDVIILNEEYYVSMDSRNKGKDVSLLEYEIVKAWIFNDPKYGIKLSYDIKSLFSVEKYKGTYSTIIEENNILKLAKENKNDN